MEQKKLIMFSMVVGSTIGGFIPSIWDAGLFSLSSVLLSAVGGFLGIYIGYKLGQ